MIRAVIDTSVLIHYLIRPSAAIKELVEYRWLGNEVLLVTAPELLAAIGEVLCRGRIRALVEPEEAQALLDAIHRKAEGLPPLGPIPSFCRDGKDDKFVACALAGDARYVVTTDGDLLALGTLADTHLVTPTEFMSLFRGAE